LNDRDEIRNKVVILIVFFHGGGRNTREKLKLLFIFQQVEEY